MGLYEHGPQFSHIILLVINPVSSHYVSSFLWIRIIACSNCFLVSLLGCAGVTFGQTQKEGTSPARIRWDWRESNWWAPFFLVVTNLWQVRAGKNDSIVYSMVHGFLSCDNVSFFNPVLFMPGSQSLIFWSGFLWNFFETRTRKIVMVNHQLSLLNACGGIPHFRHTQMNGYRSISDSCLMLATGMRLSIAARTITEWADDHQKNEDLSKNRPNIGNLLRTWCWFRMI